MRDLVTAAELTSRYTTARTELLARPVDGARSRQALVALTDRWLTGLFRAAGTAGSGAALVAVGGLGRGELAPGSDLDLVLLHPAEADAALLAKVADELWYPIWDSGIRLDHSVRSPAQARRLAAQDLKVVMGLLDARTVAGDPSLLAGLRESVFADWRGLAVDRLEELRLSVEERSERSGELAHLLEPDLKESHGGLRDVTTLRAVAASWVTDAPVTGLGRPYAFLLDVRDALHRESGRGGDRLLQQEQHAVAAALGHADADALLRAVSSAGRAIAFASDSTWHRVRRTVRPRSGVIRRLRPVPSRTPLAAGVVVQDGEAVLAADARPDRDPVLVLRAAAAAAQAGLRLAPHAVERLATRSSAMPEPWPRPARDALVSLLGAGRATLPVWESLDQAGLWTWLLPGWDVVRSAPQRNPVHRFTVDRHLVESAIAASSRTRRVARPDLLLVGALLHDLGKGRPGDHTEVGMALVAELAPRLGYDEADTAVLVRLVEHHLLLPEMATRRDLDDPATAAQVAAAVGDADLLDLLHALTEADAAATGPGAWSDWKGGLVDDLVRRVHAVLAGVASTPRSAPDLLSVEPVAAAGELELFLQHDEASAQVRIELVAPDRPGLLAVVAGVLAVHRLNVREARLITTAGQGRAVQQWVVTPAFGSPPAADRLRADVIAALAGRLDVAARLAAVGLPSDAPAPVVRILEGASSHATLLEVRAHDEPALLHRVATAVARAGATVTAARVDTLGSEVVDVLYLLGAAGAPLPPAAATAVRDAVAATLAAVT